MLRDDSFFGYIAMRGRIVIGEMYVVHGKAVRRIS